MTDSDLTSCDILGPLGFSVQILLAFLSFLVLIYKRIKEKPKRQWKVWGLDTSKQGCSQLMSHFLNIALALHLSGKSEAQDECVWYLATLVLDTTMGVFLSYIVLQLMAVIFDRLKLVNYRSGNYFLIIMPDDQVQKNEMQNKDKVPTSTNLLKPIIKIDLKAWFIQLLIWIGIVCIAKIFLFLLQLLLSNGLEVVFGYILSPFLGTPTLKLIIVMGMIPLIMNGIQFWIQDNFLKKTEFTVQEKKYVMSEMYVDEELAHFAQLDNFVNNIGEINKGSQHSLGKIVNIELPQMATLQHNGYQQADLGD